MFNQPLRNFGASLILLALVSPIFAQQSQTRRQPKPRPASTPKKTTATVPRTEPTPKADPAAEKARFEAAVALESPVEKAEALVKFIAEYPKSEFKTRAEESLVGSRAAIADARLTAGETEAAVALFKLAVENAPKPYGDRLFSEVIATIPANLYWRGHKAEGIELAKLIESHISTDANKLLLLSTFYLGSENGDEAKRIAEAVIKLDEKNAAAHQTLATAHRLNFDLESAAASFAKSVELDPESTITKRSLADMKRALGKADEAEKIYRDILAVNEKDHQASTGLVLALLDLGKRADAEAEMAKTLAAVPGNVVLLGGAAYWYAANRDGDKAVEYARRAIEKDPRYVWAHIALGRGLMLQNKPVEAEQVLVAARKYGNFPTLQYEIASARMAAGFFREAAEELNKSFEVTGGSISTRLGGRIEKTGDSFTDVIAMERRASIFILAAADSPEDAARLKALADLTGRISAETKDLPAIVSAADSFASGTDNMSVHRKLYAADLLLRNGIAADEAGKLVSSAVAGLDRSLDVANPGAAVMASELYEARNISFSRDDFLLVPDVPKQTLNALIRGRVEDTTGLALLRQGKASEATVRFRRALSVLPKDSAWWRSATWNLGTSLAAEGKDQEALDAMVSSYAIDRPNVTRYLLIEQLWVKVNGKRDGLEEKIGPNPLPNFVAEKPEATPEPSASATVTAESSAASTEPATPPQSPTPEASPSPSPAESETVKSTPTPEPEPSPSPEMESVKATPTPEPSPSPSPEIETVKATPTPEPSPSNLATVASPTAETSPAPKSEELAAETKPSPTPSETETAKNSSDSAFKPTPKAPEKLLFEPVVIQIPGRPRPNASSAESKEAAKTTQDPTVTQSEPTASGEPARPRIVEGKAIIGELLPCEIGVSQESVSLINNGGSISMLVSIEDGEDIRLVSAASNSPVDVEVKLQADTPAVAGRVMFVIKSVSDKTGLYQISFKAPCGKKDVIVRVR